jgi:hypothetical protein
MSTRVSLNELQLAGLRLRPSEAAAIVVEICRQHLDGRLPGVPSANVIRVTDGGSVVAEGPINADGPEVVAAAQLLEDLLPDFNAPPEFRTPGGLRIAIARALGTLDLPPFASLEEFRAAIERFAATDLPTVARDLFVVGTRAIEKRRGTQAPPLANVQPLPTTRFTISDVRRARRATGLSLDEVSSRSRIPAALLRELEWGYLRNWPGGLYGRTQLVRYARAAGLDEELVIQVAQPMIDEAFEARAGQMTEFVPAEQPIEALIRVEPAGRLVQRPRVEEPVEPVVTHVLETHVVEPIPDLPLEFPAAVLARSRSHRTRRSSRKPLKTALAAAAVLTLAIVPAVWEHERHASTATDQTASSPVSAPVVQSTPPVTPQVIATSSASTTAVSAPAGHDALATPARQVQPDGTMPATDTSGVSRVATQPAGFVPSFSNTGTAVFFQDEAGAGSALISGDRSQPGAILKITRIVDDNAQNFHARPSPDGSRIAFDSDREGTRAVFVADADGEHVRRMSGDGFAALPSWSPNGKQLAFVKAEADKPRVWNLWTADLGNGELHRITSYEYGQPWGGSWFPDGQRLAYGHESQLVVIDVETGARQTFAAPVPGRLIRSPAVSPDGRRVIFQVTRDGVWLFDVRNRSMRRVLDDPTAEEYSWSPDGHRVAFHSRRTGGWGVWVMGQ